MTAFCITKQKSRWNKYDLITEEMVFVWEERVKSRFITTWLWSEIWGLFDVSTRLLSICCMFSMTDRHYLISVLGFIRTKIDHLNKNLNHTWLDTETVHTLVDCFKLKNTVKSNNFFKNPSSVQKGQDPARCVWSHSIKSLARWAT